MRIARIAGIRDVPEDTCSNSAGQALIRRKRAPLQQCDNAAMDEPRPPSARQRLQALLAIPERDRTDAQWDEINELEIELASTDRRHAPVQDPRRNAPAGMHRHKPGGGQHGQKPPRRFHKRGPGGGR